MVVQMNSFNILRLGHKRCIGTRDLNACTGVVIQSPIAIILAHIAPRPSNATETDVTAGDQHVSTMMDRVMQLFETHKQYFPSATTGSGVYAFFLRRVGLPDQKRVVEEKLSNAGLTLAAHY